MARYSQLLWSRLDYAREIISSVELSQFVRVILQSVTMTFRCYNPSQGLLSATILHHDVDPSIWRLGATILHLVFKDLILFSTRIVQNVKIENHNNCCQPLFHHIVSHPQTFGKKSGYLSAKILPNRTDYSHSSHRLDQLKADTTQAAKSSTPPSSARLSFAFMHMLKLVSWRTYKRLKGRASLSEFVLSRLSIWKTHGWLCQRQVCGTREIWTNECPFNHVS